MFLFRKFHVKKDERALLFRKGDFVDVLGPGEHLLFDPLRWLTVEKFALAATRFEHRLADFLVELASSPLDASFPQVPGEKQT